MNFSFPLSKGEHHMKAIYMANQDILSEPFRNDELDKWRSLNRLVDMSEHGLNDLGVEKYFNNLVSSHPQYNAWVVDHPRYFPAILHSMSFIKIIYVHHGSASLFVKDSRFELSKGDVCFIAPKTLHSVSVFQDDALVINCILKQHILQDCFSVLLNRDDVLSHFFLSAMYSESFTPAIIFHCKMDERIQYYFEQLYEEYVNSFDAYTCHILEATLMMLFGLVLRNHSENMSVINAVTHSDDPAILECVRYLQANYATTSLTEMAERFHYSTSHLCRIIKQYTGTSFSEYTRGRRLKNAFSMLTQSDKPIKDIAEETGFSDVSSFYRSFKKQYGITPLECRNHAAETPS